MAAVLAAQEVDWVPSRRQPHKHGPRQAMASCGPCTGLQGGAGLAAGRCDCRGRRDNGGKLQWVAYRDQVPVQVR